MIVNKEKRIKINCFSHRIKYVIKLLKDFKSLLLLKSLLSYIFSIILPYFSIVNTQILLNNIQLGYSFNEVKNTLLIFVILGLLSIICTDYYNYSIAKYKEFLYLELNKKFLEESKKFDLQDFENPYIYDLIQRAEQEIGLRPFSIVNIMIMIIGQFLNLIIAFLFLITWHSQLILGFLFLSVIARKYFTMISKNEHDIIVNRTKNERKSWYISHLLIKDENIKEVKLFNLTNLLLKQFTQLRQSFFLGIFHC